MNTSRIDKLIKQVSEVNELTNQCRRRRGLISSCFIRKSETAHFAVPECEKSKLRAYDATRITNMKNVRCGENCRLLSFCVQTLADLYIPFYFLPGNADFRLDDRGTARELSNASYRRWSP